MLAVIFGGIGIIVLAGCGHNDATERAYKSNVARIDSTNSSTAQAMKAKNDADFLVFASDVGNFDMQAAQLAEKKSNNKEVKDFAAMMIEDHAQLGKSITTLAAQKNVTLPNTLSEGLKNEWNKLDSLAGKKFDKEYIDANVKSGALAIAQFQEVANSNNYSADVQQLASICLPQLRMHEEHADTLQAAKKSSI